KLNVRILPREYTKNLIGKRLSYGVNTAEVENYGFEFVNSGQQPLGLRSGHQHFVAVLRKADGHDRFRKSEIFPGSKSVKHFFEGSFGAIANFHSYRRPEILKALIFLYP